VAIYLSYFALFLSFLALMAVLSANAKIRKLEAKLTEERPDSTPRI